MESGPASVKGWAGRVSHVFENEWSEHDLSAYYLYSPNSAFRELTAGQNVALIIDRPIKSKARFILPVKEARAKEAQTNLVELWGMELLKFVRKMKENRDEGTHSPTTGTLTLGLSIGEIVRKEEGD